MSPRAAQGPGGRGRRVSRRYPDGEGVEGVALTSLAGIDRPVPDPSRAATGLLALNRAPAEALSSLSILAEVSSQT